MARRIGVNQYDVLASIDEAGGVLAQADLVRSAYRASSEHMAVSTCRLNGWITRTDTRPYLLKLTAEGRQVLDYERQLLRAEQRARLAAKESGDAETG